MKISVIGTGYVGLVTAACFAEIGHEVICFDVVKEKVDMINSGISPIFEDGLDSILKKHIGRNLSAQTDLRKAVISTDLSFICVGTPSKKNGSIDLRYIKEVSAQIGFVLRDKNYHLVVVKSTVIPETTEKIIVPILEKSSKAKAGENFGICVNPEFLREGKAIFDFLNPDRIVIGEFNSESGDLLYSIYKDFKCPILRTNLKTAEMIKYASNAFLATKISTINEIGNICKKMGIDVYDVADGMGFDSRISRQFLSAGPGFGGSCFPKDISALIAKSKEIGYRPILLESVLNVNKCQPLKAVELARRKLGTLKNRKIGILGLAFKKNTDDVRESPAIPVIRKLLGRKSEVYVYDPKAMENARKIFKDSIKYEASPERIIKKCECIIIITEWDEFRGLDYSGKRVIDTRYIIEKKKRGQIDYEGICW
jgi:UDPglucose 6-dehydrogenase